MTRRCKLISLKLWLSTKSIIAQLSTSNLANIVNAIYLQPKGRNLQNSLNFYCVFEDLTRNLMDHITKLASEVFILFLVKIAIMRRKNQLCLPHFSFEIKIEIHENTKPT